MFKKCQLFLTDLIDAFIRKVVLCNMGMNIFWLRSFSILETQYDFFVHESKWFGSWVQQQLAAHWRGRLSVNKSINFVYFSCNYILWLQNMVRKSHRLLFGCFYSAFLKLESFIHSNCMEKITEFILLCSVEEKVIQVCNRNAVRVSKRWQTFNSIHPFKVN